VAGPRVFVSLTTIPARAAGIARCIASLVNQTHPPERIFLCVPRRYRRFPDAPAVTIDVSPFDGLVEIVECAEDFGPGTKIMGALDRVPRAADTLLVLVDDDAVYEPHMLATFARHFTAHPDRAASFHVYRYRGYTIGQGVDGFAIPTRALDGLAGFHDAIRHNPSVFFVDDLWISFHLWMRNVPIDSLTALAGPTGLIRVVFNGVEALASQTGHQSRRRTMRRSIWFLSRRFWLKGLYLRWRSRLGDRRADPQVGTPPHGR
jgi:hypothetical protein